MPSRHRPLPVRMTPAAVEDLEVAFAYVEERNRRAAHELLSQFRETLSQLGEFPQIGAPLSPQEFELLEPGVRLVVVQPYVVFYRMRSDEVVVLRILHARRDSLGELLGDRD
jgi:toxin ParE1/3/4